MDPWKWILKADPYPYLFKYSPDVLKMKTKVLDMFDTDKNLFKNEYIISSSGDMDKPNQTSGDYHYERQKYSKIL